MKDAGTAAFLPLIAALGSENKAVIEAVAELLSESDDARAEEPLIQTAKRLLEAGNDLSESALYAALIKLDLMALEPLLVKVRPNSDRVVQLFEREHKGLKVNAVEIIDSGADPLPFVYFRVGYLLKGSLGSAELVFERDEQGNWLPGLPPAKVEAGN